MQYNAEYVKPDAITLQTTGSDALTLTPADVEILHRHLSLDSPDAKTKQLLDGYIEAAKSHMIMSTGRQFLNATYTARWDDVAKGQTMIFTLKPVRDIQGLPKISEGYFALRAEEDMEGVERSVEFFWNAGEIKLLKQVLNTIVADFWRNREAHTVVNLRPNHYVEQTLMRWSWE